MELKQAQHRQFMVELKTQLQKVITASEGNYCFYEILSHGLLLMRSLICSINDPTTRMLMVHVP